MDISLYGKGAIQTPKPIRQKQFHIMALAKPIDWSTSYSVENGFILKQRDQDGSSSCTAQATMYYCEALEKIERQKDEHYSARFNYSQTNLGFGQGTYIWKAMSLPLKNVASADSVPDGDSSETIMIDTSLNDKAMIEAKADKYAVIPRANIDQLAGIIEDYHGFISGFNGNNDVFLGDGTVQIPIHVDWGHCVYICGYEIRNGQKYLKFKNSWGQNWGSGGYGYFSEEFVNSGYMFDCYVYADIQDIDPSSMGNRFVKVDVNGKDVWLVRDGKRSLIYNALAFTLISGDWSKIEVLTQSQLDLIPDTGKVIAGIEQI